MYEHQLKITAVNFWSPFCKINSP